MKKQKYIDHYVIMACLSNSKPAGKQSIDDLLSAVLCKQNAINDQQSEVNNLENLVAAY